MTTPLILFTILVSFPAATAPAAGPDNPAATIYVAAGFVCPACDDLKVWLRSHDWYAITIAPDMDFPATRPVPRLHIRYAGREWVYYGNEKIKQLILFWREQSILQKQKQLNQ